MSKYTVSVFMITCNQEQFIAQAIEGVLMQQANFDYQLVIGEDCSTDKTRNICEHYAKQFPDKIKLLPFLEKNIGLIANYMRTIKECDGKYIAICDGDDYWIDELKLQKQVSFLENNIEYAIVGTNLKKCYANGSIIESTKNREKTSYEFDDLIFDNLIPSVTVLFKNLTKEEPLPSWILNFPYGDWPTYLWAIKNGGKIHFLDDITAVYRMEIGVSAKIRKKNSDIVKINLSILECILSDDNFFYQRKIIKESIYKTTISLMLSYNREKVYHRSLRLFIRTLVFEKRKRHTCRMYLYSFMKSIKLIK